MKTQIGVYVDVGTADELRTRANEVGASIGDLADLCIRYTLERMPPNALAAWATSRVSAKGRLGGAHTKSERAVIHAFTLLVAKEPTAWRFSLLDVAREAGLKLSEAYWGLKALEARGTVQGMELDKVDRWGRPIESFWALISGAGQRANALRYAAARTPTAT